MELAALASQKRIMNIWHLFPLQKQCRVAIWNGIDPVSGHRFLDQTFPPEMVIRRSDAQMMLEFTNGSTYQMLGSDSYESVIGSNPGLVIFSEYEQSDPLAWTYIAPIIRANNGGAVFISTYRGRNHHYNLVENVRHDPEWYVSFENVDTAHKPDGSFVFPRKEAEKELIHMKGDAARWREEYLNEPRLGLEGAYLSFLLSVAEVQERVCIAQLRDSNAPVGCAWAWAHSHHVWCILFQISEHWVSIVGAQHWEFRDPFDAMTQLERALPFKIDAHLLPHVAADGVPGETLEEQFETGRADNIYVGSDTKTHAGIGMVRRLLPGVLFGSEEGTRDLFDALTEFRSGGARIDEDSLAVAVNPVNDSGAVAAAAMMLVAEFKASGEKIEREPCGLDWHRRNIRRRLA
jgi:hypothetical protein